MANELDEVKKSFIANTEDHQLTVLHNQGLYKHIRFKNPNRSAYWFDITTWPNYLCISGDMGCYTFSRIEDMFDFFRNSELKISPHYWDEKIQAGAGYMRGGITEEWSQQLFNKNIREFVNCHIGELTLSQAKEVWEQVREEILCCNDEWESVTAVRDFHNKYFDFNDFFDRRCKEYTFHYLWCCYAILYAIQKYDEHVASGDNNGQAD